MALLSSIKYGYATAVTTSSGIITTRNYAVLQPSVDGASLTITWLPYAGALSYQLYRRSNNGPAGLLYTIAHNPLTTLYSFVDDGTVTLGAAPPPQNTVPIRYIQLGALSVTDRYSNRALRV